MIPKNWRDVKLESIATKISDGIHTTPRYVESSDYFFINGNNLKNHQISIFENTKCVSEEEYFNHKKNLGSRSILMSINGTIGSLANFNAEKVVLGKSVAYINLKENVSKEYIYHYLNAPSVLAYFESELTGSTIRNLSLRTIKLTRVLLPPYSEQTAIAALLSTWDLTISKTEQLIVAKEKRFTALTQKLLHNSTGGMQQFHLRDICEPVTRKNKINEINVLTTSAQHGLVSQLDYYKKSVSAEDVSGYYLLYRGEFAYNRSSSNGYPYGAIKRLEEYPQGVLSTLYLCFSLKSNAQCDSDFMAHAFEAGLLNKQLAGVCQEGARSHGLLNITKSDFFGLKISLPGISEQKQIAKILNITREEIALLKKQAEAYRRQKRALVQKLLAGEWRVKEREGSE